jgi:hypothetical protein
MCNETAGGKLVPGQCQQSLHPCFLMPLPHPPGYQPPCQRQLDRRRVLLAAHAGNDLAQPSLERALVVVLVAAGCGAWGETMRQLAGIARASDSEG